MSTSRTPAIAGFLIAGAALLALGYLASTRTERDAADAVPPISITAPADGDVVHNPVTLEFSTPADLRLTRDGWTASDLHLHAMVDGLEIMPAAADIDTAGERFTWRLPPLQPGDHRIHLTWAARHHGNLTGRTDTITVRIQP